MIAFRAHAVGCVGVCVCTFAFAFVGVSQGCVLSIKVNGETFQNVGQGAQ